MGKLTDTDIVEFQFGLIIVDGVNVGGVDFLLTFAALKSGRTSGTRCFTFKFCFLDLVLLDLYISLVQSLLLNLAVGQLIADTPWLMT